MNNEVQVVHLRRRERWSMVLGVTLILGLTGSACGTDDSFQEGYAAGRSAAPASTPALPAPTTTSQAPAVPVSVPEGLDGRNLAIVREQLMSAGFTNIRTKSDDEDDTVIILESNWTVTGIEPDEGENIMSNDLVVVSATKE